MVIGNAQRPAVQLISDMPISECQQSSRSRRRPRSSRPLWQPVHKLPDQQGYCIAAAVRISAMPRLAGGLQPHSFPVSFMERSTGIIRHHVRSEACLRFQPENLRRKFSMNL
ncbi:hypothetical protein D3C73_1213910 [compost metagenome]